jgi:Ca2+-binding RTX toxin-like protein
VRRLLATAVAFGALAAPAQAVVTVSITGTDSGDNPNDTLRVTGDDAQDSIVIREGFEGDVGPNGQADTCGGNDVLCFLTVEANKSITAQGACQRDGAATRVRCAYFHSGTARSTHTYSARVDLLGGVNDRVEIVQDAVADCCQALTTPWNWTIDYGPGNDVIDGPAVLTVPDERGTLSLTIAGGAGSDLFRGRFAARPTTLFGDDDSGAVNVTGTDLFRDIERGIGMRIRGQGGDDSIAVRSTAIGIDAGAGNDLVNFEQAAFETLGPPVELEGGSGTDGIRYGENAPALTVRLDGSGTSTGNHLLSGFESARGSLRSDTLIGNGADNNLTGGGGRDRLVGNGGDDTLDVDDSDPPLRGADDTAEGGPGADLILSNDGVRDTVNCGTSSHPETVFIGGRSQQIFVFDPDRARIDLTDLEQECEDVERQAVRTPPSARIAGAKLSGTGVVLSLRCRGVCRGRASAGGAAVRYRIRGRGSVRVPLPRAARRKLARRGHAVIRARTVELDSQGRDRTRERALLVRRK